jgi:hypothetical protein
MLPTKKLTSALLTHIAWKWRDGKKVFYVNDNQKRLGCYTYVRQNRT